MSWFSGDDDDDFPRPRRWGSTDPFEIPRAFRHGAGERRPDLLQPTTLSELREPDPLPPPIRPQRAPAPEAKPWIEITMLTDRGVVVEGACLQATDPSGRTFDLTIDASGRARTDVVDDLAHEIRLAAPIDLVRFRTCEPGPVPSPAASLWITPDDPGPYRIPVGTTRIVVQHPRATVISLDGWREGQAVLVFGAARDRDDGTTTVRAILRLVFAHVGKRQLFVIGHADTKGGQDDNAKLAAERATSVALYLSGERQAWAQHAYDNANMTTLKLALVWAARAFGIDCDPGSIGPGWNSATAKALNALRASEGMSTEAKYSPADWAMLYDLYDTELSKILYEDITDLQDRKTRLRLSDDDCGERWPVDAPTIDGRSSAQNRRVDLVICQGKPPRASIDEIYNGTWICTYLDATPEAKVRLRTVTTALAPIGRAYMLVQIGPLLTGLVTDEIGVAEFMALRGEAVTVLTCTDEWAASRLVWGMFADTAEGEG